MNIYLLLFLDTTLTKREDRAGQFYYMLHLHCNIIFVVSATVCIIETRADRFSHGWRFLSESASHDVYSKCHFLVWQMNREKLTFCRFINTSKHLSTYIASKRFLHLEDYEDFIKNLKCRWKIELIENYSKKLFFGRNLMFFYESTFSLKRPVLN